MTEKKTDWNVNENRFKAYAFMSLLMFVFSILLVSLAAAAPTAPQAPTYVSNTTYTSGIVNRSIDAKGTITTITLSATQQDYKWKAYVGNVSGTLALADASGNAVYDWSLGTPMGEVYVSKHSNINWNNIACVDQTSIDAEQTSLGMTAGAKDNINATFNYTNHFGFLVGTTSISGCRSTATYVNDAPQSMATAFFQEILLRDTGTGNLVYTGLINASRAGYNNQLYDFQIIVGENESSSTPNPYYFWVELG